MYLLINGMEMLRRISKNRKGQGMVEYGLIIALIAVVVIVALTPLGGAVKGLFQGLIAPLSGTSAGATTP